MRRLRHGEGFRVAKTPFAHKSALPCLTESLQGEFRSRAGASAQIE